MENSWHILIKLADKIATEKGITHYRIAKESGINESSISRIFNLHNCPSLDNFMKIMQVLNVYFFFEDKDNSTDLSELMNKAMDELGLKDT